MYMQVYIWQSEHQVRAKRYLQILLYGLKSKLELIQGLFMTEGGNEKLRKILINLIYLETNKHECFDPCNAIKAQVCSTKAN